MFILKKLISFFLSPLVIGFSLGVIGLYFLFKQSYKKAKIFFVLAFAWIFLISYDPIASTLLTILENKYSKLEVIPKEVTYVLALGGDTKGRSYELLRLYNNNRNLKIITSGYEPRSRNGAIHTARLLVESGIPKDRITVKEQSRDTQEEALMMKTLIGDKPFILVTSAYHMPRTMGLFEKLGLHPIAAPTDFLATQKDWLEILDKRALKNFEIALHEYIGLMWYSFKGYI